MESSSDIKFVRKVFFLNGVVFEHTQLLVCQHSKTDIDHLLYSYITYWRPFTRFFCYLCLSHWLFLPLYVVKFPDSGTSKESTMAAATHMTSCCSHWDGNEERVSVNRQSEGSSTHTPEKGKDGRTDVWTRKRRVQTGSMRGRAREEEPEVDSRWLSAASTAAEASQEKHWSKQLFSSHFRDVEHN